MEQSSDECCPGPDVTAADVPNLPCLDYRHRLVASRRSSGRETATKAKSRTRLSVSPPAILLDDVVQVFHLPQL
jgi:hypothetical protein